MTKQEYMTRLKESMTGFRPDMVREVLEDYETHFAMGEKNGKTEEQICMELGDIDEFITELAQMESVTIPNKETDLNIRLQEMSPESPESPVTPEPPEQEDMVGSGAEEGRRKSWESWETQAQADPKDSRSTWTSQAQEEARITDRDAQRQTGTDFIMLGSENHGRKSYEEEGEEGGASRAKNLVLEGLSADIVVERSEDDKIYVNYANYGSAKQQMQYRFYFREEGDTIYAGIRKSKTAAGIFWGINCPHIELKVRLPEDAGKIELNGLSGDIRVRRTKAAGLYLNTASGDMSMERVIAGRIKVSTMSGDIRCSDFHVKEADFSTKSGEVELEGIQGDRITAKSMSGDVNTKEMDCREFQISSISGDATGTWIHAEHMKCSSTSGDAEISGIFRKCHVESISGDAKLTAEADLEADIVSVSGDATIILENENHGFIADFQSMSGGLEVQYGGERQHFSRNGHLEKGGRGSKIHLKTVSGDMRIED